MRTLTNKYFGGLPIAEDTYKIDLEVLDRYQSFSAELLRLSLLGIAGYGFLIANIVLQVSEGGRYVLLDRFARNEYLLAVGAFTLGLSAAAALGHRFYSTDCLTHFVRQLRLRSKLNDAAFEARRDHANEIIEHEEESLDRDLRKCKWLLVVACASLVAGVACVAVAFAATLFR